MYCLLSPIKILLEEKKGYEKNLRYFIIIYWNSKLF